MGLRRLGLRERLFHGSEAFEKFLGFSQFLQLVRLEAAAARRKRRLVPAAGLGDWALRLWWLWGWWGAGAGAVVFSELSEELLCLFEVFQLVRLQTTARRRGGSIPAFGLGDFGFGWLGLGQLLLNGSKALEKLLCFSQVLQLMGFQTAAARRTAAGRMAAWGRRRVPALGARDVALEWLGGWRSGIVPGRRAFSRRRASWGRCGCVPAPVAGDWSLQWFWRGRRDFGGWSDIGRRRGRAVLNCGRGGI